MNTAKVYIKHDKEKIKLPVKRKVRVYSEKYAEKKDGIMLHLNMTAQLIRDI